MDRKHGSQTCRERGVKPSDEPCILAPNKPWFYFQWEEETDKYDSMFANYTFDDLLVLQTSLDGLLRKLDKYKRLIGKEVSFILNGIERRGTITNLTSQHVHLTLSYGDQQQVMKLPLKETAIFVNYVEDT